MNSMKKLLPLATIASIAAVVVPIATSCASNPTAKFLFDENNREYQPDCTPLTGNKTIEEATNQYFDDASNNFKIVAQDYIWSVVNNFISDDEENDQDINGKVSVTIKSINPTKKTISGSLSVSGSIIDNDDATETTINAKTTINFTNCIFSLYKPEYSETDGLCLHIDKENMLATEDSWSINVHSKLWTKSFSNEVKGNANQKSPDNEKDNVISMAESDGIINLFGLDIKSYYLKDVTLTE